MRRRRPRLGHDGLRGRRAGGAGRRGPAATSGGGTTGGHVESLPYFSLFLCLEGRKGKKGEEEKEGKSVAKLAWDESSPQLRCQGMMASFDLIGPRLQQHPQIDDE